MRIKQKKVGRLLFPVIAVIGIGNLVSCDWKDEKEDEPQYPSPVVFDHHDYRDDSVECEESSYRYRREGNRTHSDKTYYCYESGNQRFLTTCSDPSGCSEVDVNVHYMIPEDLGENYVVHIEAFDNYKFTGHPQSTTIMTNFSARQGEWSDTRMMLADGQYYLRAYLSTAEEAKVPMMFEGMELIADQPVGVFGALSSPSAVDVSKNSFWNQPVVIYLDKLFKDPSKLPETQAHVRVKLGLASGVSIEKSKKVYIKLHKSDDFEINPVIQMTLLSDPLVDIETGKYIESVTDQLETQKLTIFAYVDENDNGYFDDGEPNAVYEKNGRTQFIDVDENATRTVSLTLKR